MSKSKHPARVSKAAKTLANPESTSGQKSSAGRTLRGHQRRRH